MISNEVLEGLNYGNSLSTLLNIHPCVHFVSLRDARSDGSEEASPGGETPCRCQGGGLHPHHRPDCCECETPTKLTDSFPATTKKSNLTLCSSGADGDSVSFGGSVPMGSLQHLLHPE